MELKELLRLDILGGIEELGTGEVLQVLSESVRATGARRFEDWDRDLQRLADALEALADRAKAFEGWYGFREP